MIFILNADYVKAVNSLQFLNDEPVELEKLIIYPITVRDVLIYDEAIKCLLIEKNDSNDPEIISMSYLDYLWRVVLDEKALNKNEESITGTRLTVLIALVLKNNTIRVRFDKDMNHKTVLRILYKDLNEEFVDIQLNKNKFDLFKMTILCQNDKDFQEEYMSADLRKELELKRKMEQKNREPCDIEKRICSIMYNMSMSLDQVLNLSYRKFCILVEMIDKQINYIIFKQASLHPLIKGNDKIPHYLDEVRKNFEDEIITMEELQNKIGDYSKTQGGNT